MKNKKLIEEMLRTTIQNQVDFIEYEKRELEKMRQALKEPVSYTHLDVYKRQLKELMENEVEED